MHRKVTSRYDKCICGHPRLSHYTLNGVCRRCFQRGRECSGFRLRLLQRPVKQKVLPYTTGDVTTSL